MKNLTLLLLLLGIYACQKDRSAKPAPLSSITVTNAISTLKVSNHFTIEYQLTPANTYDSTIIWTSSDPSIAFVDGQTVYGIKEGTCQITGKSKVDGVEVKINLTVEYLYIESVQFMEDEYAFAVGQTPAYVTYSYNPDNANRKDLIFSIAPESVATIDQDGNIKCIAPGEATVTLKTKNSTAMAICKVKIHPIPNPN
ncbi:Ig-like domain-containing protein [Niabella sp. CC-SYL272]|uniref:Ig-like domain-containing protein n=1 Tax=Niabella agricola TaxID=2891571 RepID=UPI001F48285B|nr:Ig-like domain-containing protein [Niabella agricola]MCF3108822.1 Ig-like domain-containing protein [Niabella agricola]